MCDITTVEWRRFGLAILAIYVFKTRWCACATGVYCPVTVFLLFVYGVHHEGVADYGAGSESEKRRGRMSVLRPGAQNHSRAWGWRF